MEEVCFSYMAPFPFANPALYLRQRNTEQQHTLDQAVNEKCAKIGKVEILRANLQKVCLFIHFAPSSHADAISKAATVHNEETAKLRAAKESLEAAQVAAQKKQEAELERLRTQLVFKLLEMESSRKAVCPEYQRPHKHRHPPNYHFRMYRAPLIASTAHPRLRAHRPTAKRG